MKSIRQRLFRSHFAVILVTLGVLAAGALFFFLLWELFGGRDGSKTRGDDFEGGPGIFGLLVPLGAALIAAGLVSRRVSQRLATPIESMRAATTRIASGDYDIVVDGGDTAELSALADDVNAMADQIATTEARRLQLIGDIAHELRNPLSTIEGSMEALMDGVIDPSDETYAGIAREAARLKRLAGDLSALSAAGERAPGHEAVDLAAIATEVVERLGPQATAAELDLSVDTESGANVVGSADQLTQVLTNVVGNALRYTPDGSVLVSVRSGTHRVEVTVADTGRGLAADDLERIFERFVRVDDGFTDGTGVGLAIARALVQAHGGTITASSPGLDSGATFVIDLPRLIDT